MKLPRTTGALGAAGLMSVSVMSVPVITVSLMAIPAPAFAHVTFETAQSAADSTYKAVLRIPHGCDGQPTLKVRVRIPDGVVAVKPMPKAGWTLDTARAPYATPYRVHGETVSEGVTEIIWSGSLPDAYYDEFVFQAQITGAFQPGAVVSFPVVQECATAREEWTEIPVAGQDSHRLKMPAPGVRITAAAQVAASVIKAGPLVVEQPWSRVTPGGAKVAGGYVRITNTGPEPDRLVGGSFPLASRVEVHEMSMTDAVMRMKPVAGGLEIGPGQTVELKPGGTHLMFLDMKASLKEGQTVKGTLVFEKAGPVEVEYTVRGMGDQGAGASQGAAPAEHHH
jgi:uncharacterized protein YcnI/copper(I)-binding protein